MAKRSKRKNNKKHQRKQLYKHTIISALMCLLVLGISYLIFKTDFLQPEVNEVTASYISFYNNDTTDMIKINNIKRLSDDIGKSIVNTKSHELEVSGDTNSDYQVVVYPMINNIDLKYINFSITTGKTTYSNSLSEMDIRTDEGIVVYNGKVEDTKKITIRMWISKEYEGEINNNLFSIKINPGQVK